MKSENKINGLGKKFVKVLMSGLCICLVLNVVWPDKEKSMTENRMLARFPALSASFLQDLDVYFSDQFAGRDLLFKGSYIRQKALYLNIRKTEKSFCGGLTKAKVAMNPKEFEFVEALEWVLEIWKKVWK